MSVDFAGMPKWKLCSKQWRGQGRWLFYKEKPCWELYDTCLSNLYICIWKVFFDNCLKLKHWWISSENVQVVLQKKSGLKSMCCLCDEGHHGKNFEWRVSVLLCFPLMIVNTWKQWTFWPQLTKLDVFPCLRAEMAARPERQQAFLFSDMLSDCQTGCSRSHLPSWDKTSCHTWRIVLTVILGASVHFAFHSNVRKTICMEQLHPWCS